MNFKKPVSINSDIVFHFGNFCNCPEFHSMLWMHQAVIMQSVGNE